MLLRCEDFELCVLSSRAVFCTYLRWTGQLIQECRGSYIDIAELLGTVRSMLFRNESARRLSDFGWRGQNVRAKGFQVLLRRLLGGLSVAGLGSRSGVKVSCLELV